jgi:hypothetical protein
LSQRSQDQPIVGGQIPDVCARNAMQSINHLCCKELGLARGLRRGLVQKALVPGNTF